MSNLIKDVSLYEGIKIDQKTFSKYEQALKDLYIINNAYKTADNVHIVPINLLIDN